MNSKLAEFLTERAAMEFRPGEDDCGLWLADWFMVATGKPLDPADGLRGRYCDFTVHGVLDIARRARRAGLNRTSDPMRGDIGIIAGQSNPPCGAIKGLLGWNVRTPGGLGFVLDGTPSLRTLAAWSISEA